jgi:hypothetical protein
MNNVRLEEFLPPALLFLLLDAERGGAAPNWDLVTNRTFEDKKGKGRHMLASMLIITKASKYKE